MADIARWLWIGSGAVGAIILLRSPDRRIFDMTAKGLLLQTWLYISVVMFIALGPVVLIGALLIRPKKLCPACSRAIPKRDLICKYCSSPVTPAANTIARPLNYSPEVRAAIARGTRIIMGSYLMMMGIMIVGTVIGLAVIKAGFVSSFVVSLIVGFIFSWLWWSYSVPRWRRDALRQGANADELQAAAEDALLVWPKGSIFEKTEFKVKD